MDVNGASPCTSLSAGTVRRSVDLRTQRCDSTVGNATWADIRVLEANLTAGVEFDSLLVTVRDGTSGATLLTQQMVGTNGILSLAGINATTHPSLTLDATSESVGDNVPWADGNPPRLELRWNSDPTDGCFRTTTVINCPTITPSSIGVVGTPAGGASGAASLTMNPSPQCKALTAAKTGTGTGTVTSNPAGITCGATCTARYLSGTSVTLTATATAGSTFTGWSGGGCSGTGTCVVTLTADTTVTATFELLPEPHRHQGRHRRGSVIERARRHHLRRDLLDDASRTAPPSPSPRLRTPARPSPAGAAAAAPAPARASSPSAPTPPSPPPSPCIPAR